MSRVTEEDKVAEDIREVEVGEVVAMATIHHLHMTQDLLGRRTASHKAPHARHLRRRAPNHGVPASGLVQQLAQLRRMQRRIVPIATGKHRRSKSRAGFSEDGMRMLET
jgi:hypothetical protein